MIDRPGPERLLRAMAETLADEVLPATDGKARHAARVVANLCEILAREAALGQAREAAASEALSKLLGMEGPVPTLAELSRILEERIASFSCEGDEESEAFAEAARRLLLEDARRRLEIDRPGYAS
jgi:hypothetical protein